MADFNLTDQTALFKIKYGKLSENTYNSANVMLGRIKKEYQFTGKKKEFPVPTTFQGGVGSGSLPTANPADYGDVQYTAKKVYGVCQIDRESIKASMGNEGAFMEATKHVVGKTVESWTRNASRIIWNDGTGALGTTTAANAGGTATVSTHVIANFKEANFEENDYVNVDSYADVFEITTVTPSTSTVTLTRISGSTDLTMVGTAKVIYMQGSKNNDPMGLKGVCDATTSTLYGVTVGRRWQATQQAAAGAGYTPDRLNNLMLEVQRKSGKVPKMIVASFTQFRKMLNFMEDQKQYVIDPRSKDLVGKISFKGVEFMSASGAIPVFPERFVEDDRIYAINDDYITADHRPDFGWFDDDGTVFLRSSSTDKYDARYGGYYENFIVPTFQGVITGLAT